jgi:ABC-type branched-subunit amino acid transport system substrate-binding protein
MINRFTRCSTVVAVIAAAALIAACGNDDDGGGGSSGSLKTGPGMTAKTISIGVISDLSGIFAPLGKNLLQGHELFWDEQNAAGGICGREVKLVVRDHGYNPQTAVSLYRNLEPDVAMLQQLLGSPMGAALLPTIERDKMTAGFASWAPALVSNPYLQMTGTTYDLDTMNGIDWLVREKGLKRGDTIGHVFFEGEFGESTLIGSRYASKQLGLKLVEQKVKPTENDMSAQVATLKRAGVKAILAAVGPRQVASVAGVARAGGLNVPIMASFQGFAPQLLATPAKGALEANLHVVTSVANFSNDKPGPAKVAAAFKKAHPKDTPTSSVDFGYVMSQATAEILKKACANKDLTREGLVRARQSLSEVDSGGILPVQDFTRTGDSPSRETYILKVDAKEPGGLTMVQDLFESDMAKGYKVPSGA